MKIIPAIDIQKERCVRLTQGDFESTTVYGDPYEIASEWVRHGATTIQVIDLDAAHMGKFVNVGTIKKLIRIPNILIQYGGGVRTEDDIKLLFSLGINRVIVSSSVLENGKGVEKWAQKYRGQIIVSLDGKNGYMMTQGWKNNSGKRLIDIAKMVQGWGIKQCIYTDTLRDGTLSMDKIGAQKLIKDINMDTIFAGGIRDIMDIVWLKNCGAFGAIIGKALHEKTINLKEAISNAN